MFNMAKIREISDVHAFIQEKYSIWLTSIFDQLVRSHLNVLTIMI